MSTHNIKNNEKTPSIQLDTSADLDDAPSLAPLQPHLGILMSVVPKTTDTIQSAPNNLVTPQKKRRKSRSVVEDVTPAPKQLKDTSPTITRRSQDLRSSSSRERANISVFINQNVILLRDNLGEYESIVIEKKNGHPGSFSSYKKEEHQFEDLYIECYGILGIITIDPTESHLILITGVEEIGDIFGDFIYKITKVLFVSFRKEYASPNLVIAAAAKSSDKIYTGVEKFITSGLFYFSFTYHLTHSLQRISKVDLSVNKNVAFQAERRFFWNYYLNRHFIKKRIFEWVIPVVRGLVGITKGHVLPGTKYKVDVMLISRISCLRAGTRYNARGINDDGNVANFVETEQIFVVDGNVLSLVQTRGSVPVFWQQKPNNMGNFFVELTRTPEATTPAFRKHMEDLLQRYKKIHVVNLLAPRKKEGEIASAYQEQVSRFQLDKSTPKFSLAYTHWDFNAECGQKNFENIVRLLPIIQEDIENFRFFWKSNDGQILQNQIGAFRVNCLDCLDRTNVIMGAIAVWSLPYQLQAIGLDNVIINENSILGQKLNELWATNADNLSRAYAGTGALKSGFTRHGKRTVGGMMEDVFNSAMRMYVNNFKDGSRQEAIDQFLGNVEEEIAEENQAPEEIWVQRQLNLRQSEFTEIVKMRVYLGTWNVNGTAPNPKIFLDHWISPEYPNYRDVDHEQIVMYIFGLQEIVELNTASIVSADETNMRDWTTLLKDAINRKRKKSQVSLANCVQLVGLAILIFVQDDQIGTVRNFMIEKTRTGGQGFAGNKGALAARFDLRDTPICIVAAHLTAGQTRLQDRLDDIRAINENTRFSFRPSPRIEDHDYVFWFGDFNFRIDLPYEEVIARIDSGDIDVLLQFDQLNKSRKAALAFPKFMEGPITFLPTYKYDAGVDVYDSSDKSRAPAWTDRILYRAAPGLKITQLVYSRGELYLSDHRPVKTLFDMDTKLINHDIRDKIEKELYAKVQEKDREEILKQTVPTNATTDSLLGDVISNPPTGLLIDLSGPLIGNTTTNTMTTTINTSSVGNSTLNPSPVSVITVRTKTQEAFIAYKNSLIAVKSKLSEDLGPSEIKTVANLAGSVIKTIMIFLTYFERNEKANKLLQILLIHSNEFGPAARYAASKPDDKNSLQAFSEVLSRMITAIEDHIEYLT